MRRSIVDYDDDDFEATWSVNAKGLLNCTSAAAAVMKEQPEKFVEGRSGPRSIGRGVIVNLVSMAGCMAFPKGVAYVSSKHAAQGVTLTAGESNAFGVTQMAISKPNTSCTCNRR